MIKPYFKSKKITQFGESILNFYVCISGRMSAVEIVLRFQASTCVSVCLQHSAIIYEADIREKSSIKQKLCTPPRPVTHHTLCDIKPCCIQSDDTRFHVISKTGNNNTAQHGKVQHNISQCNTAQSTQITTHNNTRQRRHNATTSSW